MIELNVYKNTDTTSAQYGKAYCRVDYKQTFDVPMLAKHMAEHNTPFSEGTIRGILTHNHGVGSTDHAKTGVGQYVNIITGSVLLITRKLGLVSM